MMQLVQLEAVEIGKSSVEGEGTKGTLSLGGFGGQGCTCISAAWGQLLASLGPPSIFYPPQPDGS
jgi:hypothetical protein